MYRRYERMGFTNGEGNQGIINKAKWRIHFIGTKQSLEKSYAPEQKKGEKWKQRLLVRFSIDLLRWGRQHLRELGDLDENGEI